MKLKISGTGHESEEWPEVEYTLVAESDTYKTTVSFWDNDNPFDDFARKLLAFPFESRADVAFKADGVSITIHLEDPAGRTTFQIETEGHRHHIKFEDFVEVAALEKLSQVLRATDFAKPSSVEWESTV